MSNFEKISEILADNMRNLENSMGFACHQSTIKIIRVVDEWGRITFDKITLIKNIPIWKGKVNDFKN